MSGPTPTIAVLGAGGLIGQAVGEALRGDGFRVVALARRFTAAQAAAFAPDGVTAPLAELDVAALSRLLRASGASVVVNCLGVLQDGAGASTKDVHEGFVARLVAAIEALPEPALLVQVSMPGREEEDRTAFARTKREAERLIAASAVPHLILRPGFVIAPAAFGGSALMRALAMLPFGLPRDVAARPFSPTAIGDVAASIAVAARRWTEGRRDWRATWEIGARERSTVGDVLEAFRRRLGGPRPLFALPGVALALGAFLGDLASRLGWAPPIRSTALAEMRRGIVTDTRAWTAESGLDATSLDAAMTGLPASVQERWFGRLFLAKALMIAVLSGFWLASGLVALTVAFGPASAILSAHGVPPGLADVVTVTTGLLDVAIGVAIACRRTCRLGLLAGISTSLGYLAGSLVLAPSLWLDPLGPLVKVWPVIVLMLVALLVLDAR